MTTKKTTKPADDFQQFWDAYGLKRDRVAAERAWRKLSKSDRRAALAGISHYRDDCEARGIQRMYAQGYLNHRRWEDEDTDPSPNPAPTGVGSGYRTDRRNDCRTISAHNGAAAPLQSRGVAGVGSDTTPDSIPDMAIW